MACAYYIICSERSQWAKRIPLLRVLIRSKCCIIWAVFVSDVSYLENMCFLEVAIFCDNPHGKDVDLDYYIVILFSYQTLYHTDLHEMIPHLTNLYSNKNVIYFRRVVTR